MEKLKMDKKKGVNKNTIVAIIAVVVIVVLVIVGGMFLMNKKDNRKELEKSLEEMGRDFYENFY